MPSVGLGCRRWPYPAGPGRRPVPRVCRLAALRWCAPPAGVWSAQRLERRPHLGGEQVGLFPGGEVAASVEPVVVDEVVGVCALGPAARGLVELVGEDADGKRDRDGLGVEEVRLVLPERRSQETPVLVSQYSVMLSRMSSLVRALCSCPCRAFSTSPGWPVPSPWSSMNAARSAGESASPYSVCGRVVMICA